MGQMTIRADDELIEQAKARARQLGQSLNHFVSFAIRAAVDPELEGDEAERLRARFRAAGILDETPIQPTFPKPSAAALRRAQRHARGGTSISDLIVAERNER